MVGARRCLVVLAATLLIVLTACTAPAEPQSTLLPTAPLPEPSFVEPPHGPSSVFIPRAEWDPDAEVLRVWAFVTALSEEGGECTLLAVAGESRIEATSPATADASTTVCGELDIADPVPATWTLTVSYTCPTVSTVSQAVEVVVS